MALGWIHLLLLLPVVVVVVEAAGAPTPYPYDCRRSHVGCQNDAGCNPLNGKCVCGNGTSGDNCGLTESTVKTCDAGQCENNAICTTSGGDANSTGGNGCFCDSNTYGTQCENARVTVWCTGEEMFINIYPHGDNNFTGKLFVSTLDNNGRNRSECTLKAVSEFADLGSTYPYVLTAQNVSPTLAGWAIVLKHKPDTNDTEPSCVAAQESITNETTEYVQKVVVEYNDKIVSGVDQVIDFKCSIRTSAGDFDSEQDVDVKIVSDDYTKVNATDTIDPVKFEIKSPDGRVVTNNVQLGDPLDLLFTLANPGGFPEFKVTTCTAANSAPDSSIQFVLADCPAAGSELLYRGNIVQDENKTQTTIPLSAFRFVGSLDSVAFTCQIKLCTAEDLTADATACTKTVCPTEALSSGGSTAAPPAVTPDANATTTDAPDTNATTPAADANATTPAATTAAPAVRRRRDAAANDKEKVVSQSIEVMPSQSSGGNGDAAKPDGENPVTHVDVSLSQDCLQQKAVVNIIVIFVVILCLLLVIIVVLVGRLLRSRVKVVDYHRDAMSNADTQSRYSLPRLSLATTM